MVRGQDWEQKLTLMETRDKRAGTKRRWSKLTPQSETLLIPKYGGKKKQTQQQIVKFKALKCNKSCLHFFLSNLIEVPK